MGPEACLGLGWTSSVNIFCIILCWDAYALSTHLKHNGKKRVNLPFGNIHTGSWVVHGHRRGGVPDCKLFVPSWGRQEDINRALPRVKINRMDETYVRDIDLQSVFLEIMIAFLVLLFQGKRTRQDLHMLKSDSNTVTGR
jgi:hypothetical protein